MTADTGFKPPIFVLGAPFSGASLLAWSMAQHVNIEHAVNTGWLADLCASLGDSYEKDATSFESSMLQVRGVSRASFFAAFGDTVNRLFLSEQQSGAAPTRWIDSTPQHAYAAAALSQLFPEARFIHVLRGIESILSVTSEPIRDLRHEGDEETTCRVWLEATRAILEAEREIGAERMQRVRYRDLQANPEASLRSCFAYIEETFEPASLRLFSTLTPPDAQGQLPSASSGIRHQAEEYSASLGL